MCGSDDKFEETENCSEDQVCVGAYNKDEAVEEANKSVLRKPKCRFERYDK